jgi:hypothetical protein
MHVQGYKESESALKAIVKGRHALQVYKFSELIWDKNSSNHFRRCPKTIKVFKKWLEPWIDSPLFFTIFPVATTVGETTF